MEKRPWRFLEAMLISIGLSISLSSEAQPVAFAAAPKGSTNFVTVGDFVYFTAEGTLWRTDGTAEGTIPLKSGFSSVPQSFTEFKGSAVFRVGGHSLWRSDGTPAGTIPLTSATLNAIQIEQATDGYLFFQATDVTSGTELFRTDGTPGGTMQVMDLNPGSENGFMNTSDVVGDKLFFAGNNGVSGTELWKTDGTTAGTVMVKDINPGPGDGLRGRDCFSFQNNFYFAGFTPTHGVEPWISDGTESGTRLLKDLVEGNVGSDIDFAEDNMGSLYFATTATVEDSYFDLWRTDGTPDSTVKVERICSSCNFDKFLRFGGKLYFTIYEGVYTELWSTDGSSEGTNQLFSQFLDGNIPLLEEANNHLFFYTTSQGHPLDLYARDENSRTMSYRFSSAGGINPIRYAPTQSFLFFADNDGPSDEYGSAINPQDADQLMQTDGRTVTSLRDIYGISFQTGDMVNYDGKLLFVASGSFWIHDPNSSNEQTGKIQQELWNNVMGSKVSAIPLNIEPSSVKDLNFFETATNSGDNYGSRVRGYVKVPETGNYIFWIASDDQSQLWLSTDDNPGNKRKIAEVTGWTTSRQWGKYISQQSVAISLVAGQKYYIEALHKEGTGGDNLAVGWQLPNGMIERPIPGSRLIPFKSNETPPEPCAGTGMIRQEFWTGVSGTRVSDIPVNEEPDFRQDLTIFEGPASAVGDNYGSRIRGYICPPASGQYIFWIAGDDQVELSLSTDDKPANKRRIAYHSGWTNKREWTKYTTQQSSPITLQVGQRYYIEALMKEGTKSDHVSVGWQQPNGTMERPIAGSHLTPFGASDPDPDPTCAGTGTISVETWTNIDGTRVSSIPVDSTPNLTGERSIFEAPTNIGNNFGSRFRGYVCVPTTGNYTLWIASDDHSELWLSTDNDPANKRRIAYHTGWTTPRQWTKYATQQSAPISLVAGQQYYIEALYKEDESGDNMAVGWQLPDGTIERPIPGNRLSPFKEISTTIASQSIPSEEKLYEQISVYPNPASSGEPGLTISGYNGIARTVQTNIEISSVSGEVIYRETIECGGGCSSYLMQLNEKLSPGVYLVKMNTRNNRHLRRLLVY